LTKAGEVDIYFLKESFHEVSSLSSVMALLQMQSCSSDVVVQLVKTLVHDYCHLLGGVESPLRRLPALSAHFTCNFITALCRSPGQTSAFSHSCR